MADKIEINAEVKSNVGAVGKDAASAASEFRVMGVSLNGVKAAFAKIIPTAKAMFGTIKAGIISTGIGALLIAVTSLFSYFKNTQKGAEMLERAMAGLGAVVGEISDLFAKVGEIMVGAFKDPKKAIKDLWQALKKNLMNRVTGFIDQFKALGKVIKSALSLDWDGVTEGAKEYGQALVQVTTGLDTEQQKKYIEGLKNIAKEMDEDVKAAMRLKGVMQGIRREEMEFTKEQAQTRQDVAKARLLAMDESKTQEERLKAINSVMANELKMTADIIEMQKKKVAAKREELTLNKTMIEDEEELAQLEVELIDLTTKSTMTQKRLMLEVETLTNEMIAKKKSDAKEAADADKKRIKSQKQDGDALAQYNLTRLKDETDEAFKIRMDAAAKDQKQAIESAKVLSALANENLLAEIDNIKERALKKLEIEHEAKLEELKDHENFLELKAELDAKFQREKEELDEMDVKNEKKVKDAKKAIRDANMSNLEAGLGMVKQLAGDNKEVQAAVLIAENAAGIAKILINTAAANAKAVGASPLTSGMPWVAINSVSAGIGIASSIAATAKGLAALGESGGGGGGGQAPASAGGSQTPAPQMMSGEFQLEGGVAPEPVKAFVVTDEMTSSQAQLANIRRRATI